MNLFSLTDALRYGLIGLAAILAILSYFLIRKEQAKEKSNSNILNLVYVFMGFSCILLVFGLLSQNKESTELYKFKSGFEDGALNGRWKVEASDTTILNNPDFKTPAFNYVGTFDIKDNLGIVYFNGTLNRIDRLGINSNNDIRFEASGPLNNNYVGTQYYFKDIRGNGFGTMLVKFNHGATTAVAYFLFRPSISDKPFGLAFGKLTRIN